MNLQTYLQERKAMVDEALAGILPERTSYPQVIYDAMRYSIFAGGKRLRPILCLAGAEALGREVKPLLPVACSLELIHTYSLIHDDLPAMDNDDYRRGKPTNHKIFGEGIAVLAGDALLTLAFEVLATYGSREEEGIAPGTVLKVIQEIAVAAGVKGMIGGQVADLQAEGKSIDAQTLVFIHTNKTGALFTASIRAGALLSGAAEHELAALTGYARDFGLAFQITDDLLDITGDENKLGKAVGSDLKKEKSTYPALYGLEKSRDLALEAVERAVGSLQTLRGDTRPLEWLARFLLEREA